jgi:predicted phage terminase large subunit-like protein
VDCMYARVVDLGKAGLELSTFAAWSRPGRLGAWRLLARLRATFGIMIEGPSGLLSIAPNWNRPNYEPSKRRLSWQSGAIASAYSSEEADRLRGPQFDLSWADELAAWADQENTWNMLMFGLRLGARPRVCVSTTPRPSKLLKDLVSRVGKDVVISRGSTLENSANLAPAFLNTIIRKYQGTRIGRQELEAELLEDVEGALWSLDLLETCRVAKGSEPLMKRIVVGVDPAVSVSETSDLTGIIVAGLGMDGHGYVLEDLSSKFSPVEWAQKAIAAYKRHKADRIVAEANQGGAMVEATLRAVDRNVPVTLVHATRNKITRAEPISALYEQHRVHHVGGFAELEDELCTFAPGSVASPDRLDAMVWSLTFLMIGFEQSLAFHVPIVAHNPLGTYQPGLPHVLSPAVYGDMSKPGGMPAGQVSAVGDQFAWTGRTK